MREIDLREVTTVVITADTEGRRARHMQGLLARLGLGHSFETGIDALDATGTRIPMPRDLTVSMLAALRRNRDRLPLLVLEDDLAVTSAFRHRVAVPEDADQLFLGISGWGMLPEVAPTGLLGVTLAEPAGEGLARVFNMLSGHAILYLTRHAVACATGACIDALLAGHNWDREHARAQRAMRSLALVEPAFCQADALQSEARRAHLNQQRATAIRLPVPALSDRLEIAVGGARHHRALGRGEDGLPAWIPAEPPMPGTRRLVVEAALRRDSQGVRCRLKIEDG